MESPWIIALPAPFCFAHFRKVNNSWRAPDGASLPQALGTPCECPIARLKVGERLSR